MTFIFLSFSAPPVITSPKELTWKIMAGESVTIECLAESDPSSSYVWKNTAGAVVADGRELRLHNVNDSSGGNYICTATNKLGSDDRSIIVLVRSKLFFSFLYFFNLLTACMPFQETSKEKGQKHIGRKPFAFDMCRLVQTIQQKLCFEFFVTLKTL